MRFATLVAAALAVACGAAPAVGAPYYITFGTTVPANFYYCAGSNCGLGPRPIVLGVSGQTTTFATLPGTHQYNFSGFGGFDEISYTLTTTFDANGVLASDSIAGTTSYVLADCLRSTDTCGTANFSVTGIAITLVDSQTGIGRVMLPLPEPSTWGMMLLGFALAGLALQYRAPVIRIAEPRSA